VFYVELRIDIYLQNWCDSEDRKALLIRGARQIGKTFSVRQLGHTFQHLLEVNFEEDKEDYQPISQQSILNARNEILDIHMADSLEDYLLQIILATRNPGAYGDDLATSLQYGPSPRASIALDRCARAKAWLKQQDFVDPADIQDMAYDVLRHRLILTYEAEAEGLTTDDFIKELLCRIAIP